MNRMNYEYLLFYTHLCVKMNFDVQYNISNIKMIHSMLFILLIAEIFCQCEHGYLPDCVKGHHTETYRLYWKSKGNANNYFYDAKTFGMNLRNPCQRIKDKSAFMKALNVISCTGIWCKENRGFKCDASGNNQACYNMEHIIDKEGCGYDKEDTNILGNLVMAYGKWNQEVSHSKIGCCANALREKTEIYGKDMVNKAIEHIKSCKNKRKRDYSQDGLTYAPIDIDLSEDEQINEFNYSECDKSCTCESNRYLDILCGCDYSETDFDPSCQTTNTQSSLEFYRGAFISSNLFLIMVVVLLIISFVVVMREKNKGFEIPPEFNVEPQELSEDSI
jgi:hypothetical protein